MFMFFTQSLFAVIATWLAYATYTLSVLPQIRLNFKRKSANGLSDLFLLGLLNRNVMWVGYIFALGLPLSYQIMGSALALVTIVLVVQRVMYAKRDKKARMFYLYGINTVMLFILVFCATKYSIILGHCLGWVNIILGFFNEVPQAMKMHRNKTCKGFSFNYVLIGLFAYCFEFGAALILQFPFQVFLCSLKGILFRVLFLSQFIVYKALSKSVRITTTGISLKKMSLKRAHITVLKKYKNKEYFYDFVQ
jgi:uncharacterized protein with PQ loop repeat